MKTGTTTIGILCSDGIVISADKRATAGHQIMNGRVDKVHAINDRMAITIAGTVSDALLLIKYIKAESRLNRLKLNRFNTVKETANLIGHLVYSNIRRMSMIPGITHFVFGGKNEDGSYELYDIFPDGSVTQIENFISSGSGSPFATGVLQTGYDPKITVAQGIELAKQAIDTAARNDSASGNGMDIFVITAEGVKHVETIIGNRGILAK